MLPVPRILTDAEIAELLAEPKELPHSWKTRLKPRKRARRSHLERRLRLLGSTGNRFRVNVRDNPASLFDFSIILTFVDRDGTEYRLLRCNGKHPSDHTNKWEKKQRMPGAKFRNAFHTHRATERYQQEGFEIDGYAEETDKYYSFDSALEEFARLGSFVVQSKEDTSGQKLLFD